MSFVVNNKKLYNLLLRGWFNTKQRASRQEYMCAEHGVKVEG